MLLLEYQLDKAKTVDFFVMANFLGFTLFLRTLYLHLSQKHDSLMIYEVNLYTTIHH